MIVIHPPATKLSSSFINYHLLAKTELTMAKNVTFSVSLKSPLRYYNSHGDSHYARYDLVHRNDELKGKSFRLHHYHVIQIRCILFGEVFILQVPCLLEALHGHPDGVVAVLAVDFIDGFGQG